MLNARSAFITLLLILPFYKASALSAELTMNDGKKIFMRDIFFYDSIYKNYGRESIDVAYLQWGSVRFLDVTAVSYVEFTIGSPFKKTIYLSSNAKVVSEVENGIICIIGVASDTSRKEIFCNFAGDAIYSSDKVFGSHLSRGGFQLQSSNVTFTKIVFIK